MQDHQHPSLYRPEVPLEVRWGEQDIVPADRDPAVLVMAAETANPKVVTPFRLYRVRAEHGNAFNAILNDGDSYLCLYTGCAFINHHRHPFRDIRWKRIEVPLAELPPELR